MQTGAADSDFALAFGGPELLDRVEPLWVELRRHHAEMFERWQEELLGASFAQRRAGLINKGSKGLLVLLAVSEGRDVGYCVCTIGEERLGEVDSIYIAEGYRRRGIGKHLMKEAMGWLKERGAGGIVVDVMAENQEALRFYEKFGFAPRTVRMKCLGLMSNE